MLRAAESRPYETSVEKIMFYYLYQLISTSILSILPLWYRVIFNALLPVKGLALCQPLRRQKGTPSRTIFLNRLLRIL
jgi:hypothetical protein